LIAAAGNCGGLSIHVVMREYMMMPGT